MFKKIDFSSSYIKGTLDLFKGSLWAQVIGFLGALWVAKLYGANELGVFSKFMSLSSILGIFYTLRLEAAIVTSKEENNKHSLFSTLFYTIIFISSISVLLTFILPSNFFSKINLVKIVVLAGIFSGVLKAFENVFVSYLLKTKKFKKIALSRVLFTLSRYTLQISLFFLSITKGIIYGYLIASILVIMYLYKYANLKLLSFDYLRIKKHIKDNSNLVSFGVLSDNLNVLNLQIIPLVGGIYFSNSNIGWYFLAITVLTIPIHFVNTSFSKVFFLKASEIYNDSRAQLFSFVKKSMLYLIVLGIIPYLFLILLSPYLIAVFFDESWSKVGIYIQVLATLFFLRAIYNPISNLEEVFKKNHIGFVFNVYLLLVNLIAIYIGNLENNLLITLKIIAVFCSFGYIAITLYFYLYTKKLSLK